jgi:hypothetical protein
MTVTEAIPAPPTVRILGEHAILAEAIARILPHVRKSEPNEPATMLNHLVIEADGTLAAANNVTIAAYREAVTPAPGVRVLIELPDKDAHSMLKRLARKATKESPLFGVTLAPSGQTMMLSVGRESMTITPSLHPEEYPDWRHLFRRHRDALSRLRPASVIGLNASYLSHFGGAMQLTLGGPHDAVVVRYASLPQFWGMIMPWKIDDESLMPPFPDDFASDEFSDGFDG